MIAKSTIEKELRKDLESIDPSSIDYYSLVIDHILPSVYRVAREVLDIPEEQIDLVPTAEDGQIINAFQVNLAYIKDGAPKIYTALASGLDFYDHQKWDFDQLANLLFDVYQLAQNENAERV